jgi:hypothetical protein
VQPKAWQHHHGIGPTPDAARQRAVQLYPALAPRLARKADAHRADALLIASYGQHVRELAQPGVAAHMPGHHHDRDEDAGADIG